MNREASLALTRRLIERIQSNTTDQAEDPLLVSANEFLDAERWQRERQQFFLDCPQVIGFAGQLADPGAFLSTEIMGIPIVATRAEDGVLRAFVNACGHRGAQVATGHGQARRLTCSFHGWSYALDGQLAGRPKSDAFAGLDYDARLVALPITDRGGLLVVGASPDVSGQLVDHWLDDIAAQFNGFGFDQVSTIACKRLEVDANWKLVAGLSHESYHFSTLHRDSLSPFMTSHAVADEFGKHSRWAFAMRGIEELLEKDPDDWPTRAPLTMNHTVFPGTVIVVSQKDAQMIRVEPGSRPGHSVIYYLGVCDNPDTLEQSRGAYEFGGKIFETEDLPIAVECQQGLAAGRQTIIIGRNEPIVHFWHRNWNTVLY